MRLLSGILLIIALAGCTPAKRPVAPESAPTEKEHPDQLADSLMRTMSLEERVGQLFMPATFTSSDPATISRLTAYVADAKIGGVVFLKGDTASMLALTDKLQSLAHTPLFLAIDAEWGLGMRLKDAESFPHNSSLSSATAEQMQDYGRRVGRDARRLGLNMILGPVLDVAPPESVMADRSFGADAGNVATLGVAYSQGLACSGIIPVAKHFPGHGATEIDSHRSLPVITRTRTEFEQTDLLPFRKYIHAGLPAIMAGHVAVPSLTGDSLPCSISPALLTGLLREQMNFKGLIITDAMNMDALSPSESKYVASILAGADIILVPEDTSEAEREVMQALRSGRLPAQVINDRCRRILLTKLALLPTHK